MEDNVLDQDWGVISLLRFAFPTMVMMVFMGLYTMVDTIFVARFVNTDALSAINIVCPVVNIAVGIGTMIAAGGNAVVSREMGAGRYQEAREDFTLLVAAALAVGAVLLAVGVMRLRQIVYALGASRKLFLYCKDYLGVLLWFIPANVVQTVFSNLFVTAGRPRLGLGLSVLAGAANIILDYVLIALCGLGIRGAALGTGCGWLIPAAVGMVFFSQGKGTLFFTTLKWKWPVLREICLNGFSEMAGQLAAAVTTCLFNLKMMELAGEDGVAAVTIIIYAQFLLNTLYIGFSMGVAPVIGFNYGNKNNIRQKVVFRICMGFVAVVSVFVFGVSMAGGRYVVGLFVSDWSEVYAIGVKGFFIFSYSFLFCGLNIFTSALFTALSNGKVSAALSFFRTFVLVAGGILLLPEIWGIDGVWLAVPAAEGIMFLVSLACLACYRETYSY